jgi:hypothetical protein
VPSLIGIQLVFIGCTSCWRLLQKISQPIVRSKQTPRVCAAILSLPRFWSRNAAINLRSNEQKTLRSTRVKTALQIEQRNLLAKKTKLFLAFSKENLA